MSNQPVSQSQDFNAKKLSKGNIAAQSDINLKSQTKPLKNLNSVSVNQQSTSFKRKIDDDFDPEITESPQFKTTDGKKGQLSADLAKGILGRNTVSSTKSNISRSLDLTPNFYETLKDMIEGDSSGKKIKEVEIENNRLRAHLKELNEKLTKFLTVSKIAEAKPKRYPEFKDKSDEEQLNTIQQEMSNNDKILEIKMVEYNKLKDRLDMIKEPGFTVKLEDEIEKVRENIKKVKRENVKLANETSTTGKNLNNIENVSGIPENIKEANEKAREIILLRRKLEAVKEKNQKFEEEKKTKSAKAEELTAKLDPNAPTQPPAKLIEKFEELTKQAQRLEEGIKLLNQGREIANKAKFKKAISDLEIAVKKDREFVAKLDEMINLQSTELKDMLDKESLSGDKNSVEVINKLKGSMDGSASRSELRESTAEKKPDSKPIPKEVKPKQKQEVKTEPREEKQEPKPEPRQEIKKAPKEFSKKQSKQPSPNKSPEPIDEDIDFEEIKKVDKNRKSPVKELGLKELNNVKEVREVKDLKSLKSPEQKEIGNEFKKTENLKMPERKSVSPQREHKKPEEDLQLPEASNKKEEKNESPKKIEKNGSKEELVLNDEFKPKKKKTIKEEAPPYEIKPKEEKQIDDPFSKFDNIDPLELTKDKKITKPTKDMTQDASEAKPARKRQEEKEKVVQELPHETHFQEVPLEESAEKKKKRRPKEDELLPLEDDAHKKEEVFDLTKTKDELKKRPTAKLEKLDLQKRPTVVDDSTKKESTRKEVKNTPNDFFEDLDV